MILYKDGFLSKKWSLDRSSHVWVWQDAWNWNWDFRLKFLLEILKIWNFEFFGGNLIWNFGLLDTSFLYIHIHGPLLWLQLITDMEKSGVAVLRSWGCSSSLAPGAAVGFTITVFTSAEHRAQKKIRCSQIAVTHSQQARREPHLQQGEVSTTPIQFQRTSMKYPDCQIAGQERNNQITLFLSLIVRKKLQLKCCSLTK